MDEAMQEELSPDIFTVETSSILVLDRVEIYPEFRGMGIGLEAIDMTRRHIGAGCPYSFLKVFPLQFEIDWDRSDRSERAAQLQIENLPKDQEYSTQKLRSYYERAGYRTLRDANDLMVRMAL